MDLRGSIEPAISLLSRYQENHLGLGSEGGRYVSMSGTYQTVIWTLCQISSHKLEIQVACSEHHRTHSAV